MATQLFCAGQTAKVLLSHICVGGEWEEWRLRELRKSHSFNLKCCTAGERCVRSDGVVREQNVATIAAGLVIHNISHATTRRDALVTVTKNPQNLILNSDKTFACIYSTSPGVDG